mmetsp:Transcript_78297/g.209297  ORF Transcript_78297/g.209297 Transcript_78297/m.209297 type:complete len:200 (-) Transcript_78297:563-1162(-)
MGTGADHRADGGLHQVHTALQPHLGLRLFGHLFARLLLLERLLHALVKPLFLLGHPGDAGWRLQRLFHLLQRRKIGLRILSANCGQPLRWGPACPGLRVHLRHGRSSVLVRRGDLGPSHLGSPAVTGKSRSHAPGGGGAGGTDLRHLGYSLHSARDLFLLPHPHLLHPFLALPTVFLQLLGELLRERCLLRGRFPFLES